MLTRLIILDFNRKAAREAADIVGDLKANRKTIDKPDLFIAATAIVYDLPFDTLNTMHFLHIEKLNLHQHQ